MEFKDYYATMGVSKDATQDEVKRAYRKLARKYHPDVSKEPDAEARFKEIGEAYEVLKDPEKRAAYDRLAEGGYRGGEEFRPPPGWDSGFEFRGGGGFSAADAAEFSEFFENLFGGGSPFGRAGPRAGARARGMRGEDHYARVRISLEDAYHGATRTINLQRPEVDPQGHVVSRTHSLQVKIPPGVAEGQHIRLAGQGNPGVGEGGAGDLYLEIGFEPHPIFQPDGRDVTVTLPIAPWEAALGAKVPVPTLGGKVELTIPPGAQSGQKLRLKGRGLPGPKPGDQLVVLQIRTPPARSDRDKELYQELAKAMPFNPRERLGV